MKEKRSILFYGLVIVLLFVLLGSFFWANQNDDLSYSQIVDLIETGQVQEFYVKDNIIYLTMNDSYAGARELQCELADVASFREENADMIRQQYEAGILKEYNYLPDSEPSFLEQALPWLLVGAGLILLWGIMAKRANSAGNMAGFGKARANVGTSNHKVTFDDVAGAKEEKEELEEIVDFLKNPEKYWDIGAQIPKGVLLVGPPGTGKTLLARATAGEAGVPFLSISGSDFMELYVGVGASRVRDLFDQAKKMAPAVIFIDEIDAVGRRRGAGMGGGHDEREQTLNQLLVEMNGFVKNEGVIVLAATNREDILDPALLRPGRFDRKITVGRPDVYGREEILKVHAKNKRFGEDVDLKTLALNTGGFTGADLSNLLNEAAILAVRQGREVITASDLDESMMKVMAGTPKRSRKQLERDRRLTAIHEAGHAVATYHLPTQDPVYQITIVPRGNAAGLTWSFPTEESDHMTRNEMYERIVCFLGGRVAEALCLRDVSTGASNDLQRASQVARDMVARYGMSTRLGAVSYADNGEIFVGRDYEKTKSYSEATAGVIDSEVKALMDQAYQQCEQILQTHMEQLKQVTKYLLKNDTMDGETFKAVMEGKELPDQGE